MWSDTFIRTSGATFGLILSFSSHRAAGLNDLMNKLVEEWAAVALAQLDAENHYRPRATRGRSEVGLALLDKLDRTLGRRSARKKATG
jgi:hypothetical protein